MSGWVDVGDDFDDLVADEIWGSGNAIQTYFDRTDGLPRTTDADGNYPFFLAASKTKGSYKGIGSETIAKDMLDVMDAAEAAFAQRGIEFTSIRGDQSKPAREKAIDRFTNDPDVKVIVCSVTAAGVGINLQVASDVVLAELSWTDAEQTQAIDRVHRIGQDKPVTAWRMIAAQTIDGRIAELIDSKAGLAARALDGSDEEIGSSVDVQLEALVTLLGDALEARTA